MARRWTSNYTAVALGQTETKAMAQPSNQKQPSTLRTSLGLVWHVVIGWITRRQRRRDRNAIGTPGMTKRIDWEEFLRFVGDGLPVPPLPTGPGGMPARPDTMLTLAAYDQQRHTRPLTPSPTTTTTPPPPNTPPPVKNRG